MRSEHFIEAYIRTDRKFDGIMRPSEDALANLHKKKKRCEPSSGLGVLDRLELLVADDDEAKLIATKKYTPIKTRVRFRSTGGRSKNITLVPAAFAEFGAFKQSRP